MAVWTLRLLSLHLLCYFDLFRKQKVWDTSKSKLHWWVADYRHKNFLIFIKKLSGENKSSPLELYTCLYKSSTVWEDITLLPGFAVPVRECDTSCRGGQALPPHSSIAGLTNIGEHSVFGNGGHGVGVGLVWGAGSHAKETVLRVDGSQFTCRDGWDHVRISDTTNWVTKCIQVCVRIPPPSHPGCQTSSMQCRHPHTRPSSLAKMVSSWPSWFYHRHWGKLPRRNASLPEGWWYQGSEEWRERWINKMLKRTNLKRSSRSKIFERMSTDKSATYTG